VTGAVIVITCDPALLAEVERAAAAAGVGLAHSRSAPPAGVWRQAPMVLVDAADCIATAEAGLPRRDDVVVLAATDLGAEHWRACLALGVRRVIAAAAADELVRLLAESAGAGSTGPGGGRAVAVIGACGGAGATVLAIATAFAAQRGGRPCVLVDLDPWGPGLDVAVGLERAGGARWGDIAAPGGRLPVEVLHRALPTLRAGRARLAMLGHARTGARPVDPMLLDTVLDAAVRSGEMCVLDLPRAQSAAADRAIARADLTVLVVPADVRGCYGAARVASRLSDVGVRPALVVRGPSPGGLGADDIAATLQLPLLVAMRPEPGLDHRLDAGDPPGTRPRGPLARAASTVLDRVWTS
jgi:secretion/DNA translocation related CpaE-like protein